MARVVTFGPGLKARVNDDWIDHYIDYKGLIKLVDYVEATRGEDWASLLQLPLAPSLKTIPWPKTKAFIRRIRQVIIPTDNRSSNDSLGGSRQKHPTLWSTAFSCIVAIPPQPRRSGLSSVDLESFLSASSDDTSLDDSVIRGRLWMSAATDPTVLAALEPHEGLPLPPLPPPPRRDFTSRKVSPYPHVFFKVVVMASHSCSLFLCRQSVKFITYPFPPLPQTKGVSLLHFFHPRARVMQ